MSKHSKKHKRESGHGRRKQSSAAQPHRAGSLLAAKAQTMALMTFDAAKKGGDLDSHWSHADGFSADTSQSHEVRMTLIRRSRLESQNNGYYKGILNTHADMVCGRGGPKLRMMTGSRTLNQRCEIDFAAWCEEVNLRRKLWSMIHGKNQDGETFGLLRTDEKLKGPVKLNFSVMEPEQCQSPLMAINEPGYVDGIKFDENDHIEHYDILPIHPGSDGYYSYLEPVKVDPALVIHWFKLERGNAHRGIPVMTSTLTTGAMSRRHREATVAAAEFAASIAALLKTQQGASQEDPDEIPPFDSIASMQRMLMTLPMGWDALQMKGEHPNATYESFHRQQISELARPLAQPYNLAACDSSTYSFASGKLDFIAYRVSLDSEREDCAATILDHLFREWFREWTIVEALRDTPPLHQWDWPTHPVIDAVAETNAIDKQLKNGTISLRQVYSDQGKDLEDELVILAEDTFGEATEGPDGTIAKMRLILVLKNTPQHCIQYVAQILGVSPTPAARPTPPDKQPLKPGEVDPNADTALEEETIIENQAA